MLGRCLLLFMVCSVIQAGAVEAPKYDNDFLNTLAGKRVLTLGSLSLKQLDDLQTNWTSTKKSAGSRTFSATIRAVKPEPGKAKKYARSGRVPFKLTANMFETRTKGGKSIRTRDVRGSTYLFVFDEAGKQVAKTSVSLEKLCPT